MRHHTWHWQVEVKDERGDCVLIYIPSRKDSIPATLKLLSTSYPVSYEFILTLMEGGDCEHASTLLPCA